MKGIYTILAGALLLIAAAGAHAGQQFHNGLKIERLLVDKVYYGLCMAKVPVVFENCKDGWVSFGCAGDFTDPTTAWRMYDQAQMAYALGLTVRLVLLDHELYNGYCTVRGIEIFRG